MSELHFAHVFTFPHVPSIIAIRNELLSAEVTRSRSTGIKFSCEPRVGQNACDASAASDVDRGGAVICSHN